MGQTFTELYTACIGRFQSGLVTRSTSTPRSPYDQFLANVQAGRVEQIVQWRNQLEVTEQGGLRSVVVPADRDLFADLGQARAAGGVGISYAGLPDDWLGTMTPWIPVLIVLAALLIWVTAIVRTVGWRQGPVAPEARSRRADRGETLIRRVTPGPAAGERRPNREP